MSILAIPPNCPDDEVSPLKYLPPDDAVRDPIPKGMKDDERVRAYLFFGYLTVALKNEFTGQMGTPCCRYKTTAAFDAARDNLAFELDEQICATLIAGQTRDRCATLLYEHLGHAYTTWGLAGLKPDEALDAVDRVRDSLAVTAI